MRIVYLSLITICVPFILAGCQSVSTVSNALDTYKILQNKDENRTASLSCSASVACSFARVDDIIVIDEETNRPTKKSIQQGLLRLEGSIFATQHQYSLSLVPQQHEIMVRFYPVSQERAEQFHLIHKFKAGHQYELQMYRQKTNGNGSLLQMATPGNLCVDLLENETTIRRFCRTHNVVSGKGEFVETRI